MSPHPPPSSSGSPSRFLSGASSWWCVTSRAALLLALGCGAPEAPSSTGLGLELRLSQAVASEVGSFQVVVLPEGDSRRCAELQRTCLKQQVRTDELLLIAGEDKRPLRALRFSAALSGSSGQNLNVSIPVGRKYAVIIEALSRASPPRFLGSSCNYLDSVSATSNPPLFASAIVLTTVDCDPTIAP